MKHCECPDKTLEDSTRPRRWDGTIVFSSLFIILIIVIVSLALVLR